MVSAMHRFKYANLQCEQQEDYIANQVEGPPAGWTGKESIYVVANAAEIVNPN